MAEEGAAPVEEKVEGEEETPKEEPTSGEDAGEKAEEEKSGEEAKEGEDGEVKAEEEAEVKTEEEKPAEEEQPPAEAPPEPEPEPPKKEEEVVAEKKRPQTAAAKKAEEAAPPKPSIPAPIIEQPKLIEFHVHCKNLKNKDFLSKSDPMCVAYKRSADMGKWEEIGRTEMINDDLNPEFADKITISKPDDLELELRFVVYDVDKPGMQELQENDLIGYAELGLDKALKASSEFVKEMTDNTDKPSGTLCLVTEEVDDVKGRVQLVLHGKSLAGKGLFTPKIHYTLSKLSPVSGSHLVVYRSEDFKGKDAHWASASLWYATLCNGDRDRELKIEVFHDKTKSFGICTTSLAELEEKAKSKGQLKMSHEGKELPSAVLIPTECKVVNCK